MEALKIRAWREHRRLTLSQLSDVTGLSRGTLSDFESGRRSVSMRHISALAGSFGCTAAQLFEEPRPAAQPTSTAVRPDQPRQAWFLTAITRGIVSGFLDWLTALIFRAAFAGRPV